VIEHIGGFRGQLVAVPFDRFDDGLHRLFAEFLGAFFWAFGQEFRRPRAFGISFFAGLNGGGQSV
jgi:hypothetical protein